MTTQKSLLLEDMHEGGGGIELVLPWRWPGRRLVATGLGSSGRRRQPCSDGDIMLTSHPEPTLSMGRSGTQSTLDAFTPQLFFSVPG